MKVPPSRPQVTVLGGREVRVAWTVPDNDGLPVTFFRIQYRMLGGAGGRWETVDDEVHTALRKYDVTKLQPGLLLPS